MPSKPRARRPSHAVVVAYLALFVALGGNSYAAISITGKNVKNNSLTGRDIKNLGTADIKNRSLLSQDFKVGQLPVGAPGPAGPAGPRGPQGATGATGTVDTSDFYTKDASDARFLGIGATAVDSDQLGGENASRFLKFQGTAAGTVQGVADFAVLTLPGLGSLRGGCGNPAQPSVSWRTASGQVQQLVVDDGETTPDVIDPVADGATVGTVTGSNVLGEADHVVYMVVPGSVWIDVFTHRLASGCTYYVRAYGT